MAYQRNYHCIKLNTFNTPVRSPSHFKYLLTGLSLLITSLLSLNTHALENRTFCVWDPVGRNGPVMTFYSDVIPRAQAWGLNIRFEAYTEETDVVDKFKAGECEAAVLTSILSRQFVKFAGTMDAIGAINSQKGLELAIATLSRSRAGKLMIEDDYEVVTTFPVGSMYAFVKDRNVDTIDEFSGQKIAILNDDPQMYRFAELSNSIPVPVTLSNFADKFKTGEVDIVIMPALAYNTFELYEGLANKGGIIDYRLYYGMLQTIAKRELFPEDFGNKMRNYMLTRMKAMNKMVVDAEDEIPDRYWIQTNQFVKDEIDHFSKKIRLSLQEDNINNPTALKLFWKIRCRLDPSRGECKTPPQAASKRKKELKAAEQLAAKQRKAAQLAKQKAEEEQRLQAQKRLEEEKRQLALQLEEQQRLEQERQLQEQKLAEEKRKLEEERKALAQEKLILEQAKSQLLQNEAVSDDTNETQELVDPASSEKPNTESVAITENVSEQAEEDEDEDSWSLWDFLFGWI